jgi:hypothetical protein
VEGRGRGREVGGRDESGRQRERPSKLRRVHWTRVRNEIASRDCHARDVA